MAENERGLYTVVTHERGRLTPPTPAREMDEMGETKTLRRAGADGLVATVRLL